MKGRYLRLFARVNAEDLIAKHGRGAEGVSMGHARACLKHRNMDALEVNLAVLREIRRRMKGADQSC